jgi:GTPase SAR1 family protein
VYDVSNRKSFESLDRWLQEAKQNLGVDNNFPFILVGNKTDLSRAVTAEEARSWCTKNNKMSYVET